MDRQERHKDIGFKMIEYIYDGEYYHVGQPDGTVKITKHKPQSSREEPTAEGTPLQFWFIKDS